MELLLKRESLYAIKDEGVARPVFYCPKDKKPNYLLKSKAGYIYGHYQDIAFGYAIPCMLLRLSLSDWCEGFFQLNRNNGEIVSQYRI